MQILRSAGNFERKAAPNGTKAYPLDWIVGSQFLMVSVSNFCGFAQLSPEHPARDDQASTHEGLCVLPRLRMSDTPWFDVSGTQ